MRNTNDLLTEPIPQTLLRFSAPFVLTAFAQMAYGLVDMMWIGRINAQAVAAVGLVGLLTWFGDALSLIGKNGMGVLVARYFGRSRSEEMEARLTEEGLLHRLGQGFQLSLLVALVYCLLGQLSLTSFAGLYPLGETVHGYLIEYGRVIFIGMVFKLMSVSYSQAYSSLGNSIIPFCINLVGLVFNMVMDPLLIFGLGPLPAMGVFGAGLATSLSQALVLFLLIAYSRRRDSIDPLGMVGRAPLTRRPDFSLYTEMVRIGLPVALMSLVLCLISMVTNHILSGFGDIAVAVGVLGSQIESICWMTTEGLGSAITSMVAQNIGAEQRKRVRDTIAVGCAISVAIGCFASFLFVFFGKEIFSFFMREEEAILLGGTYLMIFAIQEPFMGLESATSATYAALGDTVFPSVVSLITNVARIPSALLLIPFIGVRGVWLAMSLMGVLRSALMGVGLMKKVRAYLKTGHLKGRTT